MKYVIIGNSAAAIGAVEGIRQIDKAGEITVVTDENHHTYSRPLISYMLLGKVKRENMGYRGEDFYEKNACLLISGVAAVKVDDKAKRVILEDDRTLPYDRLLVATGSSPFVPPFSGLDSVKRKFTFMTLDDADKLCAALGKDRDKRVLIVGAGLIGLKCAEGIRNRSKSVAVTDLAPRVLSSILDAEGAAIVQSHIEKRE